MFSRVKTDTALTERGTRVNGNRHDILTGSNPDGTLAIDRFDTTCNGWTSYENGRAMLGHHNRSGGGQRSTSWNSAHLSRGFSQRAQIFLACFRAEQRLGWLADLLKEFFE